MTAYYAIRLRTFPKMNTFFFHIYIFTLRSIPCDVKICRLVSLHCSSCCVVPRKCMICECAEAAY